MSDTIIVLLLLACAWLAWQRPWVGVIGLMVIGVMHPQGYGTGGIANFPAYLAVFVVVALATAWQHLRARAWPRAVWDWRLPLLAALCAWFLVTTYMSHTPEVSGPRLLEVLKILPPLLLLLLLIDSADKLRWLLLAIALALGAVVLKGGYWALMTGLQDRVYGPPGSPYHDNNAFAVATVMAIPLLVLWYRQAAGWGLRLIIGLMAALCVIAALSSWSRGGLLSLGVTTLLLLGWGRRRWVTLPVALAGAALAYLLLPEAWLERMQTLGEAGTDGSAQSRIEIWRIGWDYAVQHPWFGAGFDGWIFFTPTTAEYRDWHSAYVEMAAEHGLVGLGLWLILLYGSALSLGWLAWRQRRHGPSWVSDSAVALLTALLAYGVGSAFLGIAYWELLYLLMVCAMLLHRLAHPAPAR